MNENKQKKKKNWLEWSVFACGLILVGGTLAYLVYDAVFFNAEPPRLELTFGEPNEQSGHYTVPVTVHNRGGRTAEQALIRVHLRVNENETETSEFQVDFVPRHSDREGYVTFEHDPRKGNLSGRVMGYEQP